MEKCGFGANRGVLHYVLKRKRVIDVQKQMHFWVGNMCKTARRTHGTAARSVPVADLLASEARHTLTSGHVSRARETLLYAFSQAIDRESLAGLGNSLKKHPCGLQTYIFPMNN